MRANRPTSPRIVAVAGGKGGVGKSTVAVNVATAIARTGRRVTLVDADLGAANLHTMLGHVHPPTGIAQFIDHDVPTLDETGIEVTPSLTLIAGTSRPGAANLGSAQRLRLLRAVLKLDADVVIVDVGAGTSYTVVDLVAVADVKLFVVTPQLPSVHNAYALLKACVHRVARRLAKDDLEQGMIDAALGNDNKSRTLAQLLEVLRGFGPDLPTRIVDVLARFGVGLVGNQISTGSEVAALARLAPMIQDQLHVQAPLIASIRRSPALAGSLKAGANVVERPSEGPSPFQTIADHVVHADIARLRGLVRPQHATVPLWIRRETSEATEDVSSRSAG